MRNRFSDTIEFIWGITAIFLILVYADLSRAADISISYSSDRMTVDIADASLQSVLQELSAEYGMIVLVDEAIKDKPITAKYRNLPVEKAIDRLIHPYSSATIFSKRLNPRGKEEFYISELRVFESDTGEASQYVQVIAPGSTSFQQSLSGNPDRPRANYSSPLRVPPTVPGVFGKKTYAAKAQEGVRNRIVRSQIRKISYLRTKGNVEEVRLKKEISQLRMSISGAGSDNERRTILSSLMDKTRGLNTLQTRNRNRIHSEERILRQLQMQQR